MEGHEATIYKWPKINRKEWAGVMNGAIVAFVMWLWTCDLAFLAKRNPNRLQVLFHQNIKKNN